MTIVQIRDIYNYLEQESKPHSHANGQIFFLNSGLITAISAHQYYFIPPKCIAWIPPNIQHGAYFHGELIGKSLYFEESYSYQRMPTTIKIIQTTPLLSALLNELNNSFISQNKEHYIHVFCDSFVRQTEQLLCVPMPKDPRLLSIVQHFIEHPDTNMTLIQLAEQVGISIRTFTRHFHQEVGLSFRQWRQQIRLMLSLEHLANGKSVTNVALDMGYTNVSSFIAVFKKHFGQTPKFFFDKTQNK